MTIPKHRYAGPVFHADPLIDYVDTTNVALNDWASTTPIDTSGLTRISVHILVNQTTSFTSGSFYLRGTNMAEFDHSFAVSIEPIKKEGDGTLSGSVLVLPTSGSCTAILTYTNLPRFVYPTLTLSGSGSMDGRLVVSIHGS